ncbi:MAG: hypothetical protein JOZ41_17805, partial [Chloroflexi bacterium]|nr:hypothetical protein [Chloroflexota bacterium]
MWSYSASSGTSTFTADSSGTLLEDRAPGGNYWYLQDGWGNVVALV